MTDLLRNAGVIRDETGESSPDSMTGTPLSVRILYAFSGWLASVFLLALFALMSVRLFEKPPVMLGTGFLMIAVAWGVLKDFNRAPFFVHASLSVSLASQALIAHALFEWFGPQAFGNPLPWFGLAGVELLLTLLMSEYLHRFFSSAVFAVAMMFGMYYLGFGALSIPLLLAATVWLWLHEYDRPDTIFIRQAVGWGVSLVLLGSAVFGHTFDRYAFWSHHRYHAGVDQPWIVALLSGGVLIWLIVVLTRESGDGGRRRVFALFFGVLGALLSVWMPGLSVTLTLLILGFARGNPILLGMSIAALLGVTAHFYYALHTTLLIKSALLTGNGVVLLILYAVLRFSIGGRNGA